MQEENAPPAAAAAAAAEQQQEKQGVETPPTLYGAALGSWVSARACQRPVTPAASSSAERQRSREQPAVAAVAARQRSPVFSLVAGSPPSGTAGSFAVTPPLAHQTATGAADGHDCGAKVTAAAEMSAEMVELRRQVAAEGLSTEQLESTLAYLRSTPQPPTREDEERTMRFLSDVVPLEKMTVVTTIFKILYAE